MTRFACVWTPDLGREVCVREGTSDRQVWSDVFSGRYHLPPSDMPQPPTSVLDVGANIGLTAAHYKRLWPAAQVVAVEMDEACAALAEENAPGVEVRCHAVSGRGGWGSYDPLVRAEAFQFTRGGQGELLQPAELPNRWIVSSYTLRQVIRRSFMIPDHGLLDFLKLDVEGEEWALFKHGAWAPLVRHLLVEVHDVGAGLSSPTLVAAACQQLDALGFDASHHPPHPQAVYAVNRG